jgi:hypothetical protein
MACLCRCLRDRHCVLIPVRYAFLSFVMAGALQGDDTHNRSRSHSHTLSAHVPQPPQQLRDVMGGVVCSMEWEHSCCVTGSSLPRDYVEMLTLRHCITRSPFKWT